MNHTISILALVCAVACIYLSFRSYKNNDFLKAIFFITLLGLILRLCFSSDFYLHPWDERYHALVAKNLLNHPLTPTLYDKPIFNYDYTNWTENHIWLHKQPLALWLIALSMKLFGVNEIALRLPSIILSTSAILLTYYIGCFIFNREVGLLASFFQAINFFIIQLASGIVPTDHIDTIFQFLIELGIFLSIVYIKKENNKVIIILGITVGLAVLTKHLTGLIIIPVFMILLYKKYQWKSVVKKILFVTTICISVFLPWQVYIYLYFPKEASFESIYNFRHIFEVLEDHTGTVLFHIIMMPKLFGQLVYIGLIWFLLKLYRQKDINLLAMASWLLIPYLFFSLIATKMSAYIIISAPIIFLSQALFWCDLNENNSIIELKSLRNLFLALILILPTIQTSKILVKKLQEDRNPKWVAELKNLNKLIGEKECIVFNDDHPIETMFYTSYTAYSFVPSNQQINHLTKNGYMVAIFEKAGLPLATIYDDNVLIIKEINKVTNE